MESDKFLRIKYEDGSVEYYSHEWLNEELTNEEKNTFLQPLYKNADCSITCVCNERTPAHMYVKESQKGNYFPITQKNQSKRHKAPCNYFTEDGNYESIYHKNWKKGDNGKIKVRLHASEYIVKKSEGKKNAEATDQPRHTFNRLSIYSLFERMLLEAWNSQIYRYERNKINELNKYPTIEDVYDHFLKKSRNIIFGRSTPIKDVLFRAHWKPGKAFYMIDEYNYRPLVFLQYMNHEPIEDTDNIYIYMREPGKEATLKVLASQSQWESALQSLNIRDPLHHPLMVGGWVNYDSPGAPLSFSNLTLISLSSNGVVIESSYERELYDKLHKDKRTVVREYDTSNHKYWNGMLPDGLLIDTAPRTILEVFGRSEADEIYHERKAHKVNHFTTLRKKNFYNFWYWNAYKGEQIPKLPDRIRDKF